MLPWRQTIWNSSAPAICEMSAAPLPAALIRYRQRTSPAGVISVKRVALSVASPPATSIAFTGADRTNVTPLATAFSSAAMATSKGSTKPVEGHHNAHAASALARGSNSWMRSGPIIDSSGTPLARPLHRSCSRCARSSSLKPNTIDPVRRNRKPSSCAQVPYSSQPRALPCAFTVPDAGS